MYTSRRRSHTSHTNIKYMKTSSFLYSCFDIVSYSRLAFEFLFFFHRLRAHNFLSNTLLSLGERCLLIRLGYLLSNVSVNLVYRSRYDKDSAETAQKLIPFRFLFHKWNFHGNADGNVLNPIDNFLRLRRISKFHSFAQASLSLFDEHAHHQTPWCDSKQPPRSWFCNISPIELRLTDWDTQPWSAMHF